MVMPASSSTSFRTRVENGGRCIQAIAIGVDRAGKDQRQPGSRRSSGRPATCLLAAAGSGWSTPLHQGSRPGARSGSRGHGGSPPGGAPIERLDPDVVIGLGHQLLCRNEAPFEGRVDEACAIFRPQWRMENSAARDNVSVIGSKNGTFQAGGAIEGKANCMPLMIAAAAF